MNAPSFEFLGFAVAGAVVFNLSRALAWRQLVLLVLNLVFFATFANLGSVQADLVAIAPYAGFLLAGYLSVLALRARPSAWLFLPILVVMLAAFFWLKKYAFIPRGYELPVVYLTIGLSYVFFRVLHLVIEARQGTLKEKVSLVSYVNYTLNFTSLISGPIQFYRDYHRQEADERLPLDVFILGGAVGRIATGFFKVAIISAILSQCQKAAIAALVPGLPLAKAALYSGLVCGIFPLFLYANFSGYTDFVIGVARLYRLELPENFNNPFGAENFITFWSRWHMTLSNWLKTYVYMPIIVAFMRRFPSPAAEAWFSVLAYFVTFFLVGAWHGQTSEFLVFGLLQGGGVAANKLYQNLMTAILGRKGYRALSAAPLYRAVCRGLTFTWFTFTLLWFWSSWGQLEGLFTAAGPAAFILGWGLVLLAAIVGLSAMVQLQAFGARHPVLRSRYIATAGVTAMLVIVVISQLIVAGPAPDIVYKNF
jgi:D-alanyl-lipoteichoic acid acyltransferase DltB (MBOAT superfamily)